MQQWAKTPERALTVRARKDRRMNERETTLMSQQGQHPREGQLQAELLMQTTKLALATARQVRQLQATLLRTVSVPDACHFGSGFSTLARQDRPWSENYHAYQWAQIMLLITENPPTGATEEMLSSLRTHASSCNSPEQLKEHILECTVSRTWAGDCTNLRIATSHDFQELTMLTTRLLTMGGASIRFGPPPRGPLERAASNSLNAITKR